MSDKLVQVYIRPHLVSFLFIELEGDVKAIYENKKVKLAKVTKKSSLGQIIALLKTEQTKKNISGYNIFLHIDSANNSENKAILYERINNTREVLHFIPQHVHLLNNLLEDQFRMSLVEFIKGYVKNKNADSSSKSSKKRTDFVSDAIHNFMLTHNLYDTEIDAQSLRQVYYRSQKKNQILRRFQIRPNNQVKHYKAF